MSEESFKIKVGLTIDSKDLSSFSRQVLEEIEKKIDSITYNLSHHSGNPEKLFEIVSELETLRMQIEDIAVANHEYQLYVSTPPQQPQEDNSGVETADD